MARHDLEFLVFLRPVRSRILFEQMLGRGTRRGYTYPDKARFVVFDGTLMEYFRSTTSVIVSPSAHSSSRWRASASGTSVFAIGPSSTAPGGRRARPDREYTPPRVPRNQIIGRPRIIQRGVVS